MDIWWYGHSCFRLKSREGTVLTDPFSSKLGLTPPRIAPDVVTVSHDHANHSDLTGLKSAYTLISDPGEYEVSQIFITGIWSYHDEKRGAERGRNTVYVFEVDDLRACHLGDLGHVPSDEMVEELGGIDILLIPVGGRTTINAAQAAEVVSILEPRLVIPMHYALPGSRAELDPVDRFLKEMALRADGAQDALKVSRSSLPTETQVVLLAARGE